MPLFRNPFAKRNPQETAPRNATLFCWYCDTRIGTILLNILHLIFSVFVTILELFHYAAFSEPPVLCILAIIFSGLGILGATAFNLTAIFLATCGMICLFTLYLSELHVFGLIMVVLILFCQVVFILEMRKGIMTRANYEENAYIQEEGREALDAAKSFGKDLKQSSREIVRSVSSALSSDEDEETGKKKKRSNQNDF
jgi:hypothetical protein